MAGNAMYIYINYIKLITEYSISFSEHCSGGISTSFVVTKIREQTQGAQGDGDTEATWKKKEIEWSMSKEHLFAKLADRTLKLQGLSEEIKDIAIISIHGYGVSFYKRNTFLLIFFLLE